MGVSSSFLLLLLPVEKQSRLLLQPTKVEWGPHVGVEFDKNEGKAEGNLKTFLLANTDRQTDR